MYDQHDDSYWRKLDEEMLDEWDNPSFEPYQDRNGTWIASQDIEDKMEYYGVDTIEELDSYLDSLS